MSAVARAMGVARSHLYDRTKESGSPSGSYRKDGDTELLAAIAAVTDERPHLWLSPCHGDRPAAVRPRQ
ncbi:hypothetical protein PB2503_00547 [Parvularcula bermudensis HTCC2503]|uniref:Uncharacterized protein n=1 Tax=Parvularcula bermudensis (strain ATCC BAA-594 / HTCC2503 / KCTC 12087) TaxID=314260 RepID=E0TAY1_PARBH|nr:hypothetical protein PB2503_00547 [Parvularcula bermudensis HTCC2503]